jgi:hypothetical protein
MQQISHLLSLSQGYRVTVWLSLSLLVFSLYMENMGRSIISFFFRSQGLFVVEISFSFVWMGQIEYLNSSELTASTLS